MNAALYLMTTGAVYLVAGLYNVFYEFTRIEYIQLAWLAVITLPLVFPPLANRLEMRTIWHTTKKDQK